MKLEPYTPCTPQRFWCNRCDQQTVDSEKPDTGNFYVIFGHAYNQETREYDGEYSSVMFAFCKSCQGSEPSKEI